VIRQAHCEAAFQASAFFLGVALYVIWQFDASSWGSFLSEWKLRID
jgi:hypothetical protein